MVEAVGAAVLEVQVSLVVPEVQVLGERRAVPVDLAELAELEAQDILIPMVVEALQPPLGQEEAVAQAPPEHVGFQELAGTEVLPDHREGRVIEVRPG